MFKTLLIGLGLDGRDQGLVRSVVTFARAIRVRRVLLVHVYPHEPIPEALVGVLSVGQAAGGSTTLALWVAEVKAALPGIEVQAIHAMGRPAEEIERIAESETADLVVIGRQNSTFEAASKGVRGRGILRYTGCSALVIPEGSAPRGDLAVVGMDFSTSSVHALVLASQVFRRVVAIYAYHVDAGISYGGLDGQEFVSRLVSNAQIHFVERMLPRLPVGAVVPEFRVVESALASEALALAAREFEADTIVMGSYGQTRLAALLLGSTAERVAMCSSVPVLVVRQKGDRLGVLGTLISR